MSRAHADLAPRGVDVDVGISQYNTVDGDRAAGWLLQQVDPAQQRRLAGPDGPIPQTTWPRSTPRSIPRSISSYPKDLRSAQSSTFTKS
jgi:hypothetical protein